MSAVKADSVGRLLQSAEAHGLLGKREAAVLGLKRVVRFCVIAGGEFYCFRVSQQARGETERKAD
jgi:hypothetical protein